MTATQPRRIETSKYEVDYSACVGRGSWGAVYRGKNSETGKPVLIKILDPTEMALHQLKKRGQRLEDVLAAEDRDLEPFSRVVPGRVERDNNNQPFLVMREYSRSLQGIDSRREHVGHGMTRQQALGYLHDVMIGIKELHGMDRVHNDLKLDNIVVDDESGHVFVTDLGASRLASAGISFVSPASIDVVSLRAPEIFREDVSPGKASDIYSVSSLAYRLFTGKYLFEGRFDNLENMSPVFNGIGEEAFNTIVAEQLRKSKLPRRLQKVLRKGLAYDPQKRFHEVSSFEAEFDSAIGPRGMKFLKRITQVAALGAVIAMQPPSELGSQAPYFVYNNDDRQGLVIGQKSDAEYKASDYLYKAVQKDNLSKIRFRYETTYGMPPPLEGWDIASTSGILEEKLLADVKVKDITDNFLVGELLVAYNKAMTQVMQKPEFREKMKDRFFNVMQVVQYESIKNKRVPPLDKDMKTPQSVVAECIRFVLYDTFVQVEKEYQVFDLEDILTKMRHGARMRGVYQKHANRTDFKDYARFMDPEERAFMLSWAGNIRRYLLIPEETEGKIMPSPIEGALPDTRIADRELMWLARKNLLSRDISGITLVREDDLQLPTPKVPPQKMDDVLGEKIIPNWGMPRVDEYTKSKLVGSIGLAYWRAIDEINGERSPMMTRYVMKNMANEEQTRAYELMTGQIVEEINTSSAIPITFKSVEHALIVNAGLAFNKEVDLEDVVATARFGQQNVQKAWQNSQSFDFKKYLRILLKDYSPDNRECETTFLNKWLANIRLEK